MATVIDTLLIKLGMDTADFKRNQKEATESTQKFGKTSDEANKKAIDGTKKLSDGLSTAKRELAALVAVAIGFNGVKSFVSTMVQGNAALSRTAYYTGMSARELDAWRATVVSAGGTAEGFETSIQGIQAAFQALRYGQGDAKVAGIFKSFGIAFADTEGKARPMKDVLLDLATVFNKMKPQDQLYLGKQLGLDDGTLNLLRQGRDAVQGMYDEMYKASGVTKENTEAATELQKRWAVFRQEMDGVGQAIFGNVAPALSLLLENVVSLVREFKQIDKATGGWVSTLAALGAALVGLKTGLGVLASLRALIFGGAASGAAGAAGSGAAAVAGRGLLGTVARWLGPLGLLFHTGGLNEGEDAQLKKMQEEAAKAGNPYAPAGSGGAAPAGSGATRGLRNNNPGNIRYGDFAKKMGATGKDDKGFAVFGDMQSGSNAGLELLKSYMRRGYDTIESIISRWAPSNENNTAAYIAAVSKTLGVGSKQKLNGQQLAELSQAIYSHENGPAYRKMVGAGMNGGSRNGSTTTVETKIDTINVNTAATDAQGISRDMKQSLQDNQLITASVNNMS